MFLKQLYRLCGDFLIDNNETNHLFYRIIGRRRSVVTKSIPDGCMVAGNPAKFIGYTDEFYHRLKEKHDTGIGKMNAKDRKTFLLSMSEDLFEMKPYIKTPDNAD